MSPPIPVPSKAAIHALRGLALGTSCALGLIVEDRRRRISTLRTAVNNKKKIRTSRKYHGAAEAVNYGVDEAVILSSDELHWHYRDSQSKDLQQESQDSAGLPSHRSGHRKIYSAPTGKTHSAEHNTEVLVRGKTADPLPPSAQKSSSRKHATYPAIDFSKIRDSGGWAIAPVTSYKAIPDQKIKDISTLSTIEIQSLLKEPGAYATYKAAFLAGSQVKNAFKQKLDQGWLNVSEALCLHCQANNLWPEAQEILSAVVKSGPINEARFYAHGAMAIIESLLSNLEKDGDAIAKRLHLAAQLFSAKFEQKPELHADQVLATGKDMISKLLQFNQIQLVHQVFWRTLGQQERPEQFTAWFIQSLFDYRDYKSVIKYFKLNFSKLEPDPQCFEKTVNLVLESVDAMRGAQAEQVTRALGKQCDTTCLRPKVGWFIRLLQSHWDRHKTLSKSQDFFNEILALNLVKKLDYPEEVHQIMVKLSALAGDSQAAQRYYHETISLAPRMTKSVWLNGYMALLHAKAGDWDQVYCDFLEMRDRSKLEQHAYSQTFVAILKVFSEHHTIAEVEEFIKLYTQEMNVELHRYTVTLVANKYGAMRDHEGIIGWLQYCGSQGFALDAAFTNAILRNLRLEWKMPYRDLQKLHGNIRRLDSTLVDNVTTRIMNVAAMEEGNYTGTNIKHRLRILHASSSNLPYLFKSANERDVLRAMSEELIRGNPIKTVTIYKRALRFGMPWCAKCFRIAVKATLQRKGDNFGMAIKLIGQAHSKGYDIAEAAAVLIKCQITQFRGPFEEVMTNLQTLIGQFETLGVSIHPSVLTHTAIMSTQFGQFDRAVKLCKLAMEAAGTTNPCFSRQSLRALVTAYWQTMDMDGLRWVVESLPSSPLAGDKTAYLILKSTLRHTAKWNDSSRMDEMAEILQKGIEQAKTARTAHIEVGSMMYNETLRIMKDAAGSLDDEAREHNDAWGAQTRSSERRKGSSPDMYKQVPIETYG